MNQVSRQGFLMPLMVSIERAWQLRLEKMMVISKCGGQSPRVRLYTHGAIHWSQKMLEEDSGFSFP